MDSALPALPLPASRDRTLARAIAQATPALRSFVRRRVSNLADAEDILQDTFLALATAYGLSAPIERVTGWLMRVARLRIIDRYRAQSRAAKRFIDASTLGHSKDADADGDEPERVIERWAAPAADGPEGLYLRERVLDEFEAALASLPAEQREVFVAHEFEGRSFRALAADTGTPINTLLGRKHAAIKGLRERLGDYQSLLDGMEDSL